MSTSHDTDGGFTLVELLVVVALTAIILVLLFGGISATHRFWTRSGTAVGEEIEVGAQRLRSLLQATRVAYTNMSNNQPARLLFEGNSDALTFVTLSDGYASHGGLLRVRISSEPEGNGLRVVIRAAVYRTHQVEMRDSAPMSLFENVTGFSLRYLAQNDGRVVPSWSSSWLDKRTLPWFVEFEVKMNDGSSEQAIKVPVELRHSQ